MAELTSDEKKDECVAHALKLRTVWSLQNYKRFFELYQEAPKMSGYLIDWFTINYGCQTAVNWYIFWLYGMIVFCLKNVQYNYSK